MKMSQDLMVSISRRSLGLTIAEVRPCIMHIAPKNVRPIMDSALVAMCMMQGLTSAIVNPNDLRLMETIKSCDIFKNHVLYSDSYLDL